MITPVKVVGFGTIDRVNNAAKHERFAKGCKVCLVNGVC